jgi:putative MATE family efflux protein
MSQQAANIPRDRARFTHGSTMRHVLVSTGAMGLGLMAIFLVDLADIFFLSLLKNPAITAAMGFAGPVLFFTLSICIGSSIAMGALVARHVGAGDMEEARRFTGNIFIYGIAVTGLLSLLVWSNADNLLSLLGARGEARVQAGLYLRIVLLSMPLLSVAMSVGAVLRALGDIRRSAYAMLTGSLVNACLDPLLIFGLGLGIEGAAFASVCARLATAMIGLFWIARSHQFLPAIDRNTFARQLRPYLQIAVPAILTNIATPVSQAIITSTLARFGESVMAGAAVMWRLVPVVFFALFALSAAIGPLVGQNFGARHFERVRQVMIDSLKFVAVYVAIACGLLFIFQNQIIAAFHISGDGAMVAGFYMSWIAWAYLFDGGLFASNAAFNNLGHARLSMLFNWARATLGTLPFVLLGGWLFGARGVFAGLALGRGIFGTLAITTCFILIGRLQRSSVDKPAAGA